MNVDEAFKIAWNHRDFIASVVYKTASKFGANSADIEDYTQDVVTALVYDGRLKRWKPGKGTTVKTWIAMVATQVTQNQLRRRRQMVSISATDAYEEDSAEVTLASPEPSPLDALIRERGSEIMSHAIAELDDAEWRLFFAICNGETKELGLTPVQLGRAKKRLVTKLQASL